MKNSMKSIALLALTMGVMTAFAQKKNAMAATQVDANYTAAEVATPQKKSPAKEASATINGKAVTIKYSAPSVRERAIWGNLVPYNEVWRTGANNATTVTFSEAITLSGQEVPAGTYALFTKPGEKSWQVMLNTDSKQWGAYDYDEKKNVLNVAVTPSKSESFAEQMNFSFNKSNELVFHWENLIWVLPMK